MDPALLRLMRLQLRGWLRHQFSRGSRSRRMFSVLGVLFLVVWLATASLGASVAARDGATVSSEVLPWVLTAFALLPLVFGSEDRAIAFSAAEVALLFPGPYSRRQLVAYKLIKLLFGSTLGGLMLTFWTRRMAASMPAAILGSVLTLWLVNLLSTLIALLQDLADEGRHRWTQRLGQGLLVGVGGWAVWTISSSTATYDETLAALGRTPPMLVLLAPARLYTHVFTARGVVDLLGWGLAGLLPIAAVIGLVFRLDRDYLEAALAASQRWQARMARRSRGLAGMSTSDVRPRGLPLPRFTALGGAGAIVWRQLLTAARTSRGWVLVFLFVGGDGLFMAHMMEGGDGGARGALIGLTFTAPLLLFAVPATLRFDLRGDLDHFETLKALPLSAWRVVLAEVTAPILLMIALGWTLVLAAALVAPLPGWALAVALAAMIPLAVLVIGLENLSFLVLPTRMGAGQSAMQITGRRIVTLFARMVLVSVGGVLIGLLCGLSWALTGSPALTFVLGWLALMALGLGVLGVTAILFRRYDVSVDTPA